MTNDKLKRATVYSNKASALVALNTMTINEGEILKINYYKTSDKIDSLVAIGVKTSIEVAKKSVEDQIEWIEIN